MPSALLGLVTSDNTLAPLGGSQIDGAIDAIEPYVVLRFATTTARDTAIPAPARKAGMISRAATIGYHETVVVDGGPWTPLASRDLFPGGSAVMYGSAPAAGALKIRLEGTAVLTVNSGSWVRLSMGSTFSHGIVSAIITPGDVASDLGQCIISNSSVTLSTMDIVVRTYTGATIAAGNLVRINYMIVGW